MVTRRDFLLSASAAVGGSLFAAACGRSDGATAPAPDPTIVAPTSTATSTTSTTSTTIPATSSVATTVPQAWAGADFGQLDAMLAATDTASFIVAEGDRTIHEWYRTDASHTQDIASAQKSILSLLVGRAVADGNIALDTPIDDVLGPDWTPSGQSAAITVEHLLTMTSGLDDNLAVVGDPGGAWLYSGAFAQLFDVVTRTSGRESTVRDLNDLASEWLFAPLGADGARFYERRVAQYAGFGLRCTARDLVALGRGVRDRGIPGVPEDWYTASFAPTPLNPSYGYLWWLNGKQTYRLPGLEGLERPGPLIPSAPIDMVAALGKDDQKLYVAPSVGLVVARQGGRADPETRQSLSGFDDQLWALLMSLRTAG